MANESTRASDLIVPEVWGDAIMTTVLGKSVLLPLASVDDELVGVPGDSVTFPKFNYIGDAVTLTEGVAMETSKLTMTSTKATIAESGKAVELSDTAVLTAIGSPNDQARIQLGLSIARKIDTDLRLAAEAVVTGSVDPENPNTAPLGVTVTGQFSWAAYTAGTALLGDEYDPSEIAGVVIHSQQHSSLMLDPNFMSVDKFGAGAVLMRGQVGQIGTAPILLSDRTTVTGVGNARVYTALLILKGALALKYKRRVIVEKDRDILTRLNLITTNVHYAVKRVNDRGIVLIKTLGPQV